MKSKTMSRYEMKTKVIVLLQSMKKCDDGEFVKLLTRQFVNLLTRQMFADKAKFVNLLTRQNLPIC